MSIRTFLAFELNTAVRESLSRFQKQWQSSLPPINWVKPQSIHLTVKFLGDVNHDQLEPLRLAVESVAQKFTPFGLQVNGVGTFPHLRMPRVLWAGISGQVEQLQNVVSLVEDALAPLGFQPESKPFQPHLTLARIKQHSREVGVVLAKSEVFEEPLFFGDLPVDRLCLFKSELKPTGAVYQRLWEVPLGTRGYETR